jgi:hypothetical protein
LDRIIAYTGFSDGPRRPVYEQPDGRQYVVADDGEFVLGVWFIPGDEADEPTVVEG